MNLFLKDRVISSRGALQGLLLEARPVWASLDPTFVVDIALVQGIGDKAGVQFLQSRFLQAIADCRVRKLGLLDCLEELRTLCRSNAFLFATLAVQGQIEGAMSLVDSLAKNRPPKPQMTAGSSFVLQVVAELKLFVMHETGAGSSDASLAIFGADALQAKLAILQRRFDGGDQVDWADLNPFMVWGFLCNAAFRAEADRFAKTVGDKLKNQADPADSAVALVPALAEAIPKKSKTSGGKKRSVDCISSTAASSSKGPKTGKCSVFN